MSWCFIKAHTNGYCRWHSSAKDIKESLRIKKTIFRMHIKKNFLISRHSQNIFLLVKHQELEIIRLVSNCITTIIYRIYNNLVFNFFLNQIFPYKLDQFIFDSIIGKTNSYIFSENFPGGALRNILPPHPPAYEISRPYLSHRGVGGYDITKAPP